MFRMKPGKGNKSIFAQHYYNYVKTIEIIYYYIKF